MAIEGGRVVLTAQDIEPLNFEFDQGLDEGQELTGTPTIEIRRVEGKDLLFLTTATMPENPPPKGENESYEDYDKRLLSLTNIEADFNKITGSSWGEIKEKYAAQQRDTITGVIDRTKTIVSVSAKAFAVREDDAESLTALRPDKALNSIWEVICRVKVSPGGWTRSGSMIVVGAG